MLIFLQQYQRDVPRCQSDLNYSKVTLFFKASNVIHHGDQQREWGDEKKDSKEEDVIKS